MKLKNVVNDAYNCFCSLLILLSCFYGDVNAQLVSTVAGSAGVSGFIDGSGLTSRFDNPSGIACDKSGNIYIADRLNNSIRKLSISGIASTIAGNGAIGGTDGSGSAATFYEPKAIACDTAGNIYVADTRNYKIRKITPQGIVTTVAGQGTFGTTNGPAAVAQFGFPTGICVTPDGSTIYVADHNTHVIRKIYNGQVSDLAGIAYIAGSDDGNNLIATFNHPSGIELDNNGSIIVADEWNNKIRSVNSAGDVITIAGSGTNGSNDGSPGTATFNSPLDVTVDNLGNIFVADGFNNIIRKIEYSTSAVSTYAGTAGVTGSTDGLGSVASFNNASGVSYCPPNHTLYISDESNQLIRKITNQSAIQISLTTTANNNTVCFGDSIPVNANTPGLSNYTFSVGSVLIAANSSGIVNLPPLSTGTHSITAYATDVNGAVATSQPLSITVTSPFIPTVSPSGNITFCSGDSILLTAQSGTAYLWTDGSTTQNIYINSAGSYIVTVTNAAGCKGYSPMVTAVVSLQQPAVITPSGSTTICASDSTLLTASAGLSWLWSNGATTQSIFAVAGSHTVSVTNAGGCSAISAPVIISNYPGSQAVITPAGPVTIIQGDSITFSANTASAWLWSNNATTQSIVVSNSGIYTVSILSANGCQSLTSVQVNLVTSQQLLSATGPTTFCQGNNVILQSFFAQGNQWYFNGIPMPGETNQQLTAIDSGYYLVAAFQNSNWYFSDSLLVTVNSSPQVATVSDTSVCTGTSPMLMAQADPGTTITWYDLDIGGTLLNTGNIFPSNALYFYTTYYVEVTAPNGCTAIDRSPINISVNPLPEADFQYSVTSQSGSYSVSFQNSSLGANTFTWYFNDSTGQDTTTLVHPTYIYNSTGNYDVLMVATNGYGCVDSVLKRIIVGGGGDLFIPTTFTPNNDGINDLFRVRGKNIITRDMKIYDQWGKMIFETGESRPYWDGFIFGEVVQNGTYIYKVLLSKLNAEDELVSGTITVIK